MNKSSCQAAYLFLDDGHQIVEEGDLLVETRPCVYDLVQTADLEAVGVAALAAVHEVSVGEDEFEDSLQLPALCHLTRRLQHRCKSQSYVNNGHYFNWNVRHDTTESCQ